MLISWKGIKRRYVRQPRGPGGRSRGKLISKEGFITKKRSIPVPRANYRIRYPQVRLIGADGQQLGIMATKEAQKIAEQENLDLVEISPTARPPVCRVMDLGKFKYEQSKNVRKARKKQTSTLKEMRYRPKIEKHDIEFKTRHVRAFLKAGHKVKVYVEFRGREMTHTEFGAKILSQVEQLLEDVGTPEARPRMEGRHMTMLFVPIKVSTVKKKPKPAAETSEPPTARDPVDVPPQPPVETVTPPSEDGPTAG